MDRHPDEIRRPHWAACRKPDLVYKKRKIWRVPHDTQRRVLLTYWYSEAGPTGDVGQFDVRALPDYTEFRLNTRVSFAEFSEQCDREQHHHHEIIRRAIDAGLDMVAISDAQIAREEAADVVRRAALMRAPILPGDIDDEIPF